MSEKKAAEGMPSVDAEPSDATEAEASEPVKAWVVAYAELGLLNIVAKSQEELVARINSMRSRAGTSVQVGDNRLRFIEALSNDPSGLRTMTVWIDPLLILAVLDQFKPRPAPSGMPALPPSLVALLEAANNGPGLEEDVAVVVVEPEPVAKPREPEPEPKSD